MSEDGFSFSFIAKVGREISTELNKDPDAYEWFDEVREYLNTNQTYPEDIASEIINRLTNLLEEGHELITQFQSIIDYDADNVDYFYDKIFFNTNEEEEEEAQTESPQILIIPTTEAPQIIDESALDPKSYFEYHINKLSETLFISHDISHLLLNYFYWKKDEIERIWFSEGPEKVDLLKKLRIDTKSGLVKSYKDQLFCKDVTEGECPICFSDTDLVQLYCGHILCKECLKSEIIEQIAENRPLICRQEYDDKERCDAEITRDIASQYLDENELKKLDRIILSNQISHNNFVRTCPNPYCSWIITPANRLQCNIGKCHHCDAVTCLMDKHDPHAPLRSCKLVDVFTIEIAQEMKQLEQDQNSWMAREERLKDYRNKHSDEVESVLKKEIDDLKEKQKKESAKEMERINSLSKEIESAAEKLASLKNELIHETKDQKKYERLRFQIQDLEKELDFNIQKRKIFNESHESKNKERQKDLRTAQDEAQQFIYAIKNPYYYQFCMSKFRESQEQRAYSNILVTQSDEDYVKRITRKCPKCQAPIFRDQGCNYMACNNCHFEFCWICDKPWNPTHGDHFQCPYLKEYLSKIQEKKSNCGINFDDMNDFKFYPQPMSIEKRADFIRYNNLNTKFREERDKHQVLFSKLMKSPDDSDGADTPIQILESIFKKSYSAEDSNIYALKIINTVLFAHSIIMWGYPTLYFMSSDPQKAKLFEFRISLLENNNKKLMEMMEDSQYTPSELLAIKKIIENEISIIIDDAEIF